MAFGASRFGVTIWGLEKFNKILAANLKELRGARRQSDVAHAAGIPDRTYQRMEAGVIPRKREYLAQIATYHRVPETRLFLDSGLPQAPVTPSLTALAAEVDRLTRELETRPKALTGVKRELFDLIAGLDEPKARGLLRLIRRTLELTQGIENLQEPQVLSKKPRR